MVMTTCHKEKDRGAPSAQDLYLQLIKPTNAKYTKLQRKNDKDCGIYIFALTVHAQVTMGSAVNTLIANTTRV